MAAEPMTAKQGYEWIVSRLNAGKDVYVSTCMHADKFAPKNADRFKIGADGCLYMKPRRSWLCIGTKNYVMVGLTAR